MFTISFNDDGSPIGYITLEQFAEKIHANVGSVRVYSTQGKIPEVIRICGRVYIPEHVNSMRSQYKKRRGCHGVKVDCITTGEKFDSIKEACEKYNLSHPNIVACCNGRRKTAGKKKWSYSND